MLARVDGVNLLAAYFALSERKKPLFDFLLNLPPQYLEGSSMIVGDFNTGLPHEDEKGNTFACADEFRALLGQGWIDAWRSRNSTVREFTWYSRQGNNGFRLDHALASPELNQRISKIRYSHAERESKVSDHSALVVDIE